MVLTLVIPNLPKSNICCGWSNGGWSDRRATRPSVSKMLLDRITMNSVSIWSPWQKSKTFRLNGYLSILRFDASGQLVLGATEVKHALLAQVLTSRIGFANCNAGTYHYAVLVLLISLIALFFKKYHICQPFVKIGVSLTLAFVTGSSSVVLPSLLKDLKTGAWRDNDWDLTQALLNNNDRRTNNHYKPQQQKRRPQLQCLQNYLRRKNNEKKEEVFKQEQHCFQTFAGWDKDWAIWCQNSFGFITVFMYLSWKLWR